jgi:hypothetical protein
MDLDMAPVSGSTEDTDDDTSQRDAPCKKRMKVQHNDKLVCSMQIVAGCGIKLNFLASHSFRPSAEHTSAVK